MLKGGATAVVASLYVLAGCTTQVPATGTGQQPHLSHNGPFVPPGTVPTDVTIKCLVKTDGHTDNCTIMSFEGSEKFAQSALTWTQHAVYSPRTHNDIPITVEHTWNFKFRYQAGSTVN